MTSLSTQRVPFKNNFSVIADSLLQHSGLPFASVLDAESIEHVFREEEALFGQEDVFSTQLVLWAFLAQTLRDGKGVACSAAVADLSTYLLQTGQRPPSGDTGDYCRARAKLSLTALQRLVRQSSRQLEEEVPDSWLWKGLHAKLVDGFTFTMPDTPENQESFPQNPAQRPGVGLPIARVCGVISLATACVCDLAIGPYEGKETGENALLRSLLDTFEEDDVIVFDRYFCSFMMLALLSLGGRHVCTRLHQCRPSDFRRGRRLGPGDHLITWTRPAKPAWMFQEQYARIPETLTLREVKFHVTVPGRRTQTITLITTLTDPQAYSKEDLAELYGFRWNVELDIRHIKQTLHLDHVRCAASETTSSPGLHPGLSKHPGVLDGPLDGVLPGFVCDLHHDVGPHRGPRGSEPARPHRASRPETSPPSLPAYATTTPPVTSRTAEYVSSYEPNAYARQCHSSQALSETILGRLTHLDLEVSSVGWACYSAK